MSSVVRPLSRLSVTLVDQDHKGWKSWKLIARQLAQHLRSSWPKGHPPTRRGTWGNLGETRGGEKVASWSTKSAISLKRVKIEEKLLRMAYRKSQMLFRTVPSPTPTHGLLFPRLGVRNYYPKLQLLFTDCKFGRYIQRVHPNKRWERERGRIQGLPSFFEYKLLFHDG